jgi:plastocyanin
MNIILERMRNSGWSWLARGAVSALLLALAALPMMSASAQEEPTLEIVSPHTGNTIESNNITVEVEIENFTVDCTLLGAPDQDGVGHILVFVDGDTVAQLTNFYCSDTFTIPGDGLTPGGHDIAVVLASNTHVPMMETAQIVRIDFDPALPVPLPSENYTGDPGLTLVSPQNGDTVSSSFDVQVQPSNFITSTALVGKTNVPGYGHYHVWIDTEEMPSSLAGLALMPGTNAFTLNLSAWGEGEHTVRIEPAQNDHAMYDPATAVTFTVTVEPEATSASNVTSPEAAVAMVQMTDQFRFSPADLTIAAGQTVTWINDSAMPHTATDDPEQNPVASAHPEYAQLPDGAEPWDSGVLQPGESFSYTFTAPGTYHYFCLPHVLSGMVGTITVED